MRNTSLCYIYKNKKYLLIHKNKKENDLNRDKWIGVGGKFEDKESPEQCNRREVFEETGLKLKSAEYKGIITFVSDTWETEYMHLFTSSDFTGDLKPECDEGELSWVDEDKLFTLPTWSGDIIFLRLLNSDRFFSLRLEYRGEQLISAVLDDKELSLEEEL